MQSSCIGSLMELANSDPRVVYLTADSGEGGLDLMFRRNFPKQSFDFGISEQNMVAAAAGMATANRIPFVYTAAPFLVYRSYEFIRDDICLQNLPVKLIGTGSGITVSSLGPTHHSTEDIALLRCMPNLTVLSPATPKQAYEIIREAYRIPGPVYIRVGMNKEKEYYSDDYVFQVGHDDELNEGDDIIAFTTGSIIEEVIEAAKLLKDVGIGMSVINISTIKPFNTECFMKVIKDIDNICTIEEHNIVGGLGSIVSDVLVDMRLLADKRLLRIGLNDRFTAGYGQLNQVRKENGLDRKSIFEKVRCFVNE